MLIQRNFGALALISLSSFPAIAQNVQTLTFHEIANGPTIVLHNWTCWFGVRDGCKYAPCHMTTVEQPKLGKLRPVVSNGAIPASGGVCAGTPIPVLNITYTPKPGARGADTIVLESSSDNGSRHVIYIDVDVP